MTQDPNRPRPHVVNNEEPRRDQGRAKNPSETWKTVRTVALTTLVGAGVLGAASLLWKTATKHAKRVLRREKSVDQLEPSPYSSAAYPPPPPYGYPQPAYPSGWPQPNVRDIPEALRDGPRLTNTAQYAPQAPPQVVVAPSPEIVAEIRRLGAHVDKRFAAVEQKISAMDNPGYDDDEDDDDLDDEEAPGRRN